MNRNCALAIAGTCAALALIDASLGGALAQSATTVFTNLQNKAQDLFYNIRTIVLILCALAIIATMATAISGRFPVGKALAIVGAIVVIGLSSEIVTYFATGTTSSGSQSSVPSLTDTGASTGSQ